jgi:hypothetical protein
MTEPVAYLELGAPETMRRIWADLIAAEAAAELGIPPPAVRLFVAGTAPRRWHHRTWTDDRQLHGEFSAAAPGEIWVRQGLPRDQMALTVAHEVAHVAWHAAYGSPWATDRTYDSERAADEAAAQSFARRFTARRTRR